MNKSKTLVLILSIFTTILLLPPSVDAAIVEFQSPVSEVALGQEMTIVVMLDTESEKVNAYEGTISVSHGAQVTDISTGNSVVSLWIEEPVEVNNGVRFVGITPGGLNSDEAKLFSFTILVEQLGIVKIELQNEQVLLHDGLGTATQTNAIPLEINVLENMEIFTEEEPLDTQPPEPFEPLVSSDPNVFDGQWFVSFATQDKQSGVVSYYIAEENYFVEFFRNKNWVSAESPYLLLDQSLNSKVYVKAVDKAGNERIEVVGNQNKIQTAMFASTGTLLVLGGLFFYIRRVRHRNND